MSILKFQLKLLSFVFLLNVCVHQVLLVEPHTTHRDKYLVGPVIERLGSGDWMQCLVACATSNDCVSYNFESRSGTCEFLNEETDLGSNRPFYSCVLSYLAMNASEAGVELALIQTSLLFSCKCQLVSIRTT